MMIKKWFMTALMLLMFCPQGVARDIKIGSLIIQEAWTRVTPPNANIGGAYLTIHNNGETEDRLLSAHSPIAGKVEIHEMKITDDGIMSMRPLLDGIAIESHSTFVMKPGGYHLMLMALKAPIRQGNPVPITLTFQSAGDVSVEFIVMPLGMKIFHDAKSMMQ